MKCPLDKSDMIVVEYQQIELDYCVQCAGVWFDTGELELLLEKAREKSAGSATTKFLIPVEMKSDEKKRRCPVCNQKMKKGTLCEEPQVLIDACPQGEGVWFDGGELAQVIAQVTGKVCGKSGSRDVLSFLSDVFKADKPAPY